MHVKRLWPLFCVVCFLAGARLAAAEHPQDRRGFWLGIGGGYGSADATCDDCGGGKREGSGVGFLKLGWTLNDHVLLGGEINSWYDANLEDITNEGFHTDQLLINASATVTVYPQSSSGFFVKGGIGASAVGRTAFLFTEDGSGLGLLAGVGYDVRVARMVSITPALNFWYGQPGDLTTNTATTTRNWKHNVVDLTLGITFH